MQDDEPTRTQTLSLTLAAGALAAGLGVLVTMLIPADQSGWVGVALVPFWLLLEAVLGILVIFGSIPRKPDRLSVAITVVAGFYTGALLYPVFAA